MSCQVNGEIQALDQTAGFLRDDPIGVAALWDTVSQPDTGYVIYARYITAWDDGTTLSDEEQAELLDEVVDEAVRRGWKFEIERP